MVLQKVDPLKVLEKAITPPDKLIQASMTNSSNSYCPCREFCDREKPASYFPKQYWGVSFDNFKVSAENKVAHTQSKLFPKGNKSIYLHGEPGTGKTHLMYSAYREIRKMYCALDFAAYSVTRLLKIDRDEFETHD